MAAEAVLPAAGSTWLISTTALLAKAFLFGLNSTTVHGLENLTRVLDLRLQEGTAESRNAFITVSNHTSVIDDPLIWGVLPFKYLLAPANLRWTLGSQDICFKNRLTSAFFANGRVLPTYRLQHSARGGLFQPVVDQTLSMLTHPSLREKLAGNSSNLVQAANWIYTTSPPPVAPPIWLHVFPEGQIFQHPTLQMRYFKWGIARYILELPTPPIVLPMFHSGVQDVMHEERVFPRFLPRPGRDITITFGQALPLHRWDDVRRRWRDVRAACAAIGGREGERLLREGDEAVRLRVEVAAMVRDEVEKLRVRSGRPPSDPESGLAETYRRGQSNAYLYEVDAEKHVDS
ncbi:Tafazzin [Drechslerella dactyloides]|uniref:Tafazzin family protein n=1 Tax=Drechslerella dactyloides TaxID=74499 RepID=A0AAD6NLS8_DREDA|nr:Tafazzin [Drechslerella dactyloides]